VRQFNNGVACLCFAPLHSLPQPVMTAFGLPRLGIWLLACIGFRLIAAGAWKRLADEADNLPQPRYSHGAVILRTDQSSGMLITHGYNKQGAANWLSDTWFRNVHPKSTPWQKVAVSAPKPSARLGHSLGEPFRTCLLPGLRVRDAHDRRLWMVARKGVVFWCLAGDSCSRFGGFTCVDVWWR
jgi:hypothetical protein